MRRDIRLTYLQPDLASPSNGMLEGFDMMINDMKLSKVCFTYLQSVQARRVGQEGG